MPRPYTALVSSDWNQCLAPCGPFDVITYFFPELSQKIKPLFEAYTSNRIKLVAAVEHIQNLMPEPITRDQMDAYLENTFETYTGVYDMIRRCTDQGILFMINTTGMIGYFQRAAAKGLIPSIAILSAHPMIRFTDSDGLISRILPLRQTQDKAVHTARIAADYRISPDRIILLGDSGGDGPHFKWGARHGARLIGVMTKPSLSEYCRKEYITLDSQVGVTYERGQERNKKLEMEINFETLTHLIQDLLG